MNGKKALILGCTGLVGSELLDRLMKEDSYGLITCLTRRDLDLNHPKLKIVKVDFSDFRQELEQIDFDDVFCCLGTTIKKAGSKKAFKAVDFQIPMDLAKNTKDLATKRFFLISSTGANKDSWNFYLKTKGELETQLMGLNFQSLVVFRPSLLDGDRQEFRLAESLGLKISKMIPKLKLFQSLRPTKVSKLVSNILDNALDKKLPKVIIIEHSEIK